MEDETTTVNKINDENAVSKDHEEIMHKDDKVTEENKSFSEETVPKEDEVVEKIHTSAEEKNVPESITLELTENVSIDIGSENKEQATEIVNIKYESTEDSADNHCDTGVRANRDSITVVRSMIHSADYIDLDDSVSDMANSSGEATKKDKSDCSLSLSPQKCNTGDQDDSEASFSVGSRVEAKDFEELWHPARIVEVDSDEMEVLVHYESAHRNDEWISVSSPRIRAMTNSSLSMSTLAPIVTSVIQRGESESHIKIPLEYKVGERCYARWSDNRRFPATVRSVIGNGKYEIIFDDGICRICQWYCLSKMKKKKPVPANDAGGSSGTSVVSRNVVTHSALPAFPTVPFHRHLFDPSLDYLGSKSERREMKKKLDVKALFNIGKKNYKRKLSTTAEEVPPVKKKRGKAKKDVLDVMSDLAEIAQSVTTYTEVAKDEIKEEIKQDIESNTVAHLSEISVPDIKEEKEDNIEKVQNVSNEGNKTRRRAGSRKSKSDSSGTQNIPEHAIETNVPQLEPKPEMEPLKIESISDDVQGIINDGRVTFQASQGSSNEDTKYTSPITESAMGSYNYAEGDSTSYSMDIDEGLKLIAEAVESFEAEHAIKTEAESQAPLLEVPKIEEAIPERYEAALNEGEWCCRWVDGEPQGVVCETDPDTPSKGDPKGLPRKSVMVEDKRLPSGWQKMLVRRCYGSSAGKWDVVLIDPNNRRLRDKGEMRNYLAINQVDDLKPYESILMDFSVHRKLARRLGWDSTTFDGVRHSLPVVMSVPSHGKRSPWGHKKKSTTHGSDGPAPKKKKRPASLSHTTPVLAAPSSLVATPSSATSTPIGHMATPSTPVFTPGPPLTPVTPMYDGLPYIDGHVYVGSLKVEIIENLFRCPADKCFKNFRKDNLLRMHIKHYHRELRKFLGATPKVSDLAYARTAIPEDTVIPKLKCESDNKPPKAKSTPKTPTDKADKKDPMSAELFVDTAPNAPTTPVKSEVDKQALHDSPKLRCALESHPPTKRPKVLYPVKKEVKSEHSSPLPDEMQSYTPDIKPKDDMNAFVKIQKLPDKIERQMKPQPQQLGEQLDFEAAISTHTVTKPTFWKRKQKSPKKPKREKGEVKVDKKEKKEKKRKLLIPKWTPTEAECWESSNMDSMSSYGAQEPRSVEMPSLPTTPLITDAPAPELDYMISETGERIKIEHMKREEIINCHCGYGEEDGLMIQCDLCLCWQHAICHNYDTDTVPDKYTCSICLNPRRGRASRRFLHDQAWLYEGELPGGAPDATLRRAHELTGNLLRLTHVLHTLRLKFLVATKKDHPKLYLWAKDWETSSQLDVSQDKAVGEPLHHVDLNDMFREIGKENLPLKEPIGDKTPPTEDSDGQRDEGSLGSQALLANLLSSPNGTALDLPISTSELERLAKSVQEAEMTRVGPEPEAAIESSACRKNLLRHIQRLQALIDARLDSIEAQVAELESQDQSFEDDETPEYFPRTKQTIQMLHRDLNTLEELAIIT